MLRYLSFPKKLRQKSCKNAFDKLLANGKQVAFVVRKGALEYDGKPVYAETGGT